MNDNTKALTSLPVTGSRLPRRPRTTAPLRPALRRSLASAALTAISVAGASAAVAEDWKVSVTPYVWATDVGADVELTDRQLYDGTIAFTDLLEDLDTAAQLRVEAQRGAHGFLFDVFDVQLSHESAQVSLPPNVGTEASLDSVVGMTILEAGGIYDPHGDQRGFALLYGTRILAQRAEIGGHFELFPDRTMTASYQADETLVDGLLGARYTVRIAKHWSYTARLDASAGATDLTWSAQSVFAYSFGETGRYGVIAGYRRMEVDFASDDALDVDMTLSGFITGFRVSF